MAEGVNTYLSDKDKLFLRLPVRLYLDKENDRNQRQSKTSASCHVSDGCPCTGSSSPCIYAL